MARFFKKDDPMFHSAFSFAGRLKIKQFYLSIKNVPEYVPRGTLASEVDHQDGNISRGDAGNPGSLAE